ncbi:hypothetical protein SAMN04488540_10372 [Ferrimonas sediminum]|uniref:Orphan protein n=1 Tax=Ferrimonas sediminum TaxID=718193 RepID=A0A1G8NCT4_9GAMM|nr:DUF6702 family protein [Ferrimonas sediminum]SDI77330.1 hypothetical protein SAMN04488540_10372 [Ferrimonas sediminum]
MKRLITTMCLLLLALPCWSHRYHFGMTQMSLSADGTSLEVVHRYNANDMSQALALQADEGFEDNEARLRAYLNQHFVVLDNDDRVIAPQWVGQESDVRDLWIYQELPLTERLRAQFSQGVRVGVTLLFELEPSQVNTLTLQSHGTLQTWQLDRRQPAATVQLKRH